MHAPSPPRGWILLAHPVHAPIDEATMLSGLPPEAHSLPRRVVTLDDLGIIPLEAAASIDWSQARRVTERALVSRLRPVLDASPGYHVAYFGAAPVPLAMLVGHRVGAWATLHVFQRRHDTGRWDWPDTTTSIQVQMEGEPKERLTKRGEAILRVGISVRIEPSDTLAVVEDPLTEVSLDLDAPHPDALRSSADLEEVALSFVAALERLVAQRPSTSLVHVFAAVPVGLAFRLGAAVSPTRHPKVAVYQFQRDATPRYRRAFVLQDVPAAERTVDDGVRAQAEATRGVWQEELRTLQRFADQFPGSATGNWFESLFPQAKTARAEVQGRLSTLPALAETRLADMQLTPGSSAIEEFTYDASRRAWTFGDLLLAGITRRMNSPAAVQKAGRLFLLHEVVHLAAQGITSATSGRVGRFPKVLEEVDYLADVWAMLHDLKLAQMDFRQTHDAREHLLDSIHVALESFWGFDDPGTELLEMQVRRVNRYLLWSWQRLRLEATTTFEEAVAVLAHRPLLELAGPRLQTHDERVYFALDPRHIGEPELCVLQGNVLHRMGDGPAARLRDLVEGFRRCDGALIQEALRGVFDGVSTRTPSR